MCLKKSKSSQFKIIDRQGRITLPQEMRKKLDIHKEDVVELTATRTGILISKLDIVKLNDDSLESLRNTVIASAKKLDRKTLLALAKKMVDIAERTEEYSE